MVLLRTESQVLLIIEQVVRLETFKRHSKRQQGREGSAGILFRWPNEDIKVVRCPYMTMQVHRYASDDRVINVGRGERSEE